MNRALKYGNDDDYVDSIAREVALHFCQEVEKYRSETIGGQYRSARYSVDLNGLFGILVGATVD